MAARAASTALNDGTFDRMIVDVFMPNMRGFESIKVFHSHAPTVPLIAISGYAFSVSETDDPACFRMALSLGATRCLRKPFRPATLLGEAEQRRKHAAALAAIAIAPQNISRERANTG